jgi:hypothetical protein
MGSMTRLQAETQALRTYFPQFKVQDPDGPQAGVIGRMTTNSGSTYVVWLSLGAFPNEAPKMYVVSPKPLLTYDGRELASLGMSGNMHLLQPDDHGHPQICHYNDRFWHPRVSLYKILMKARLWVEAYEQHVRHGRPIDAYLPHM